MTNEEMVLKKMRTNRSLGKSLLQFNADFVPGFFWNGQSVEKEKEDFKKQFETDLAKLKALNSVEDRVYQILSMYTYRTYMKKRFQCKPKARRSSVDIWRIYRNYFGEIDIFSIMRALFKLTLVGRKLSTIKCSTVRKQVFWIPEMENWRTVTQELNYDSELGVNIKEWENIGLKKEGDS